jgi:hypothetical protein
MDKNKLQKLREIGYTLRNCCANCEHGMFPSNNFGTCSVHKYRHLKHTGELRDLSIHKYGCCPDHKLDEYFKHEIDTFIEFLTNRGRHGNYETNIRRSVAGG